MTAAGAPRDHGPAVRPAWPRAASGAHAGRPRRGWVVPTAAVAVAVLAFGSWWGLSALLTEDSRSSTSDPPAAPVGEEPPGVVTEVTIDDAGDLYVVETLTFRDGPERLDLSVPQRSGVAEDFRPVVGSLVVDGVPGTAVVALGVGQRAAVDLGGPTTRVVLEYAVSGAAVRSGNPSAPSRALALVTPLVVAQADGLPATVRVGSVKVLNVACLRGEELTGCGTRTEDGWVVESSGGEGTRRDVLVQLDLPVP